MRTEGPDFLQKNSALAEEVRRTFVDLDEVERELGKASKATSGELSNMSGERTISLCTCRPSYPSRASRE
jgi:hypothetical protein